MQNTIIHNVPPIGQSFDFYVPIKLEVVATPTEKQNWITAKDADGNHFHFFGDADGKYYVSIKGKRVVAPFSWFWQTDHPIGLPSWDEVTKGK